MERMFRLLKASEIDARVATINQKGCSLLLYKDARVDQNILDETVGPERWQRHHEVIDGNLYCNVGIKFDRPDGYGEWVWKQDVGTESYTEKEKGQASDAFKRACFNWGIGRELYTAPFIWIGAQSCNIIAEGSKYKTNDRFVVADIGYDEDGVINRLTIKKAKTDNVVYVLGETKNEEERMVASGNEKISGVMAEALRNRINNEYKGKFTESGVCEYFKVSSLEDMTVSQMSAFNKMINDYEKKQKRADSGGKK